MSATCTMNNCRRRCPDDEPFCSVHRDKEPNWKAVAADLQVQCDTYRKTMGAMVESPDAVATLCDQVRDLQARIRELEAGLRDAECWLSAALECKTWAWDGDQWESADNTRQRARSLLQQPVEGDKP